MTIDNEAQAIAELHYLQNGPPKTAEERFAMAQAIKETLERHYIHRLDGTLRFIPGIDEAVLTELAAHCLPWLVNAVLEQSNIDKPAKKQKPMGTRQKPLF